MTKAKKTESTGAAFTLPFGKHAGKTLDKVPESYLHWCVENLTNKPDVVNAIRAFLGSKADEPRKGSWLLGKLKVAVEDNGFRESKRPVLPVGTVVLYQIDSGDLWLSKLCPELGTTSDRGQFTYSVRNTADATAVVDPILKDGKAVFTDARMSGRHDLYDAYVKPKYDPVQHDQWLDRAVTQFAEGLKAYSEEHGIDVATLEEWKAAFLKDRWDAKGDTMREKFISHYNAWSDNAWAGYGFLGKCQRLMGEILKDFDAQRTKEARLAEANRKRLAFEAGLRREGLVRCPRCGGAGRSDAWWATGYTCYDCNGRGGVPAPQEDDDGSAV